MPDASTGGFESWGIVEVMGHRQFAGHVCEVTIAGAGMVRIDVPAGPGRPAFTKLISPGALYAITPTDEATATAYAASLREQPIETYRLALPAPRPDPGGAESEWFEEPR